MDAVNVHSEKVAMDAAEKVAQLREEIQHPEKPIPAWVCDIVGTYFTERMHTDYGAHMVELTRVHSVLEPMPKLVDGPDTMRITVSEDAWRTWINRMGKHTPLLVTIREAE
jgi:hypothetical protein